MSFVVAAPELVAAAASDLEGIGSALSAATAAAVAPTTQVVAAAADEVSAAIAGLFGAHAQEFQAVNAQAMEFHDQVARVLNAGAGAYARAEAANAALQQNPQRVVFTGGTGGFPGVQAMMPSALTAAGGTALIMGATGNPQPSFGYFIRVYQRYIEPHYPGFTPTRLYTPAQFQPITGIPNLTYDLSVAEGATRLNAAIMQQVTAGNHVVALGFSQSASVATLEMRYLETLPLADRPGPDELSFALLGNPNNADGGILARFPGLYVQSLGLTFNGATPVTEYPTTIYTTQYDIYADFPQYPLNIVADLNAMLGIYYSHGLYPDLTAAQIDSGVVLPVSSADTNSTYILIPAESLPLLQPLRGIVPEPLLDLVEPDLRVIVELGYDRTGYADVPTPAGLFPTHIDPFIVAGDLAQGTVQGIDDALASAGYPPLPSPPNLPFLAELPNTSLTIPSLPPIVPDTIAVPPQIGDVIVPPLRAFDGLVDSVINGHINPAITSGIYQAGAELSDAASSQGASADLLNAIYVGRQVLPVLVEGPSVFVTADTHYLVNAVDDLTAGDLRGFNENLQLIPATNTMMLVFGAAIPTVAVVDIFNGEDFP